ncbi:MAG TPA: hypothetical protein VFX25_28530 [Streptosporangiaceae bacterium]|nr:hypothetical protein [Streptosporangiaceae bacterium]
MKKAGITPGPVSRLVAAQFPQWAGLPVRTVEADGWDNATFRLGERMTVRLRVIGKIIADHRDAR